MARGISRVRCVGAWMGSGCGRSALRMVRRAYAQRSLFEVLLSDRDKLWTDELRTIDTLLDDDALVGLIDAALRRRHPLSGRRGRLGTPATVALRILLLKHLRNWSFEECEREVRVAAQAERPDHSNVNARISAT